MKRTLRKEIRGRVISIPAIAEADDPLGRAPGELLWDDDPEGYNYGAHYCRERDSLLRICGDRIELHRLPSRHPSKPDTGSAPTTRERKRWERREAKQGMLSTKELGQVVVDQEKALSTGSAARRSTNGRPSMAAGCQKDTGRCLFPSGVAEKSR